MKPAPPVMRLRVTERYLAPKIEMVIPSLGCMRILFVGHEATRSGAPMNLLHFARWISRERKATFSSIFERGGGLASSFEELSRSPLWTPESKVVARRANT